MSNGSWYNKLASILLAKKTEFNSSNEKAKMNEFISFTDHIEFDFD